MKYALEDIARAIREARERKGLSQRELSRRSGMTQTQISKIENASLDARLSSIVELARALDLEVTFVPRKALPAVQSIVRSTEGAPSAKNLDTDLERLRRALKKQWNTHPDRNDLASINYELRDLKYFFSNINKNKAMENNLRATMRSIIRNIDDKKEVNNHMMELRRLRNQLAHYADRNSETIEARPAYSLDEDDHA